MHDINWLIADGTNVVLTVGFARQYMQKYRKPHFTDKWTKDWAKMTNPTYYETSIQTKFQRQHDVNSINCRITHNNSAALSKIRDVQKLFNVFGRK